MRDFRFFRTGDVEEGASVDVDVTVRGSPLSERALAGPESEESGANALHRPKMLYNRRRVLRETIYDA